MMITRRDFTALFASTAALPVALPALAKTTPERSTTSATIPGGTVTATASANADMKRLAGDGVTDDAPALNASLAGEPVIGPDGSIVRLREPHDGNLPTATYLIQSPLVFKIGSLIVGNHSTILMGAGCLVGVSMSGAGVGRGTIYNLRIEPTSDCLRIAQEPRAGLQIRL